MFIKVRKIFFSIVIVSVFFSAQEISATPWYIDKAASGIKNGSSWTNAWTSLSEIVWASISAGDIIYISGGLTTKTYSGASNVLTIGKSGTSGNPIIIKIGQNTGHNGTAILDGEGGTTTRVNWGGHSYIILDGDYKGSRNIKIQNNSQSSANTLLFGAGGSMTSPANGNKISHVEFYRCANAVQMYYQQGFEFSYNRIHDVSWEFCLDIDGSTINNGGSGYGGNSVHNNLIEPNITAGAGYGVDGLQGSDSIDVYNNTFSGNLAGINNCGASCHSDLVQALGGYWRIYNNSFVNHGNADIISDLGGNLIIYNNTFSGTQGGANIHGHVHGDGVTNIRIFNNTFVDQNHYSAIIFYFFGNFSGLSGWEIKNNIIYNCGSSSSPNVIDFYHQIYSPIYSVGTGSQSANVTIDYNNINAGSSGRVGIFCNSINITQSNNRINEPSFTSYTQYSPSNDLTLQASDFAAKDLGVSLLSYFNSDKDGVSRPQGSAFDIGAYESENNGTPLPPTGLTIKNP